MHASDLPNRMKTSRPRVLADAPQLGLSRMDYLRQVAKYGVTPERRAAAAAELEALRIFNPVPLRLREGR